ncbi:MAG TPA: bifunctional DNA-formamidopyrimidine glycosylase/DNA-(apurinic or apyrimidinic site) lyase [Fastidiosipila sp.]|jgi:formamidopyrimidine-DNA glycosylase|nr:bifunctional DNA-formamidopyrimidine glycosylase/DNA-(apurinic or apyrimidinic site) lyase [Fastidiosipila sp.]
MPELPEVETVRRSLTDTLSGATIVAIEERFPGVLIDESEGYTLPLTIERLRRRGKYLLFDLIDVEGKALILIAHFRMTGKFYIEHHNHVQPHTHVRLKIIKDGNTFHLDYVDVRRFGRLWLYDSHDENRHKTIAGLGPEPLSEAFSEESLRFSLKRRHGSTVKATLLNQEEIAGIGNIYADEALFRAGIRPQRRSGRVTKKETAKLHLALRDVLELGIGHRGTSFRDYVDGLGRPGSFQQLLNVYGRSGEPCHVCQTPLKTIRVAGRTTRYCPRCQR